MSADLEEEDQGYAGNEKEATHTINSDQLPTKPTFKLFYTIQTICLIVIDQTRFLSMILSDTVGIEPTEPYPHPLH